MIVDPSVAVVERMDLEPRFNKRLNEAFDDQAHRVASGTDVCAAAERGGPLQWPSDVETLGIGKGGGILICRTPHHRNV